MKLFSLLQIAPVVLTKSCNPHSCLYLQKAHLECRVTDSRPAWRLQGFCSSACMSKHGWAAAGAGVMPPDV